MTVLLDSHYHFDFLLDPELRAQFLAELKPRGVQVVAQTVTPSSFVELTAQAPDLAERGVTAPLWSLGLHPWYLQNEQMVYEELAIAAEAVTQTRFIGEIGLDFSPHRLAATPAELQVEALSRLLQLVVGAARDRSRGAPYVLSIHAVRSASPVLDLLSELDVAGHNVVPVFHRFSGTSDDLTRLIRMGGCISVSPVLLDSKRGRAYATQVPADRLLLESDLPTAPQAGNSTGLAKAQAEELSAQLTKTARMLSELRDTDIVQELEATQARLYGSLSCPEPLDETAYLLSSPANARRLVGSIERLDADRGGSRPSSHPR